MEKEVIEEREMNKEEEEENERGCMKERKDGGRKGRDRGSTDWKRRCEFLYSHTTQVLYIKILMK